MVGCAGWRVCPCVGCCRLFSAITAFAALANDGPRPFASFDHAGPSDLNDPHDLAMGPDGRLYVADKFGSRIAVLDPETLEVVEVIAAGRLPGVHDISFGPDGKVAVAVTGMGAVLVFDSLEGTDPTPVAALAAATHRRSGHSFERHDLCDGKRLRHARGLQGRRGDRGRRRACLAHMMSPRIGTAISGWLTISAADWSSFHRISHCCRRWIIRNTVLSDRATWTSTVSGRLVVADQDAHRVLLIDPDGPDGGSLLGVLGNGTPGKGPNLFDDPEGVAIDGQQLLFRRFRQQPNHSLPRSSSIDNVDTMFSLRP